MNADIIKLRILSPWASLLLSKVTSSSKLVEESLVTNYVREEYVTKSKLLLARVLKVLPLLLVR